MTVESYTGVDGVVLINDTVVADVLFSVRINRSVAEAERSGKHSKLKVPGDVDVTGTIDEIVTDGELIGMAIGNTTTTGTAVALHAGLELPGAGAESVTDMTATACTTPSRVRLTALTAAVTTAGVAVLHGTGAGGDLHSEAIEVTALAINEYVTSRTKFLTVTHVTLIGGVQAGGTIKVDSVAGSASIVVGPADVFSLVGSVVKGENNVTMSLDNCFLTSGELTFGSANSIVRNPAAFTMQDPDADLSLDYD
jgi:hypothetical protein